MERVLSRAPSPKITLISGSLLDPTVESLLTLKRLYKNANAAGRLQSLLVKVELGGNALGRE